MIWKETGAGLWFTLVCMVVHVATIMPEGKKGDTHSVMWSPPVKQWDTVWSCFDTFEVFYLKYLHWHEVDLLNSWHWLLGLATVFSYWPKKHLSSKYRYFPCISEASAVYLLLSSVLLHLFITMFFCILIKKPLTQTFLLLTFSVSPRWFPCDEEDVGHVQASHWSSRV